MNYYKNRQKLIQDIEALIQKNTGKEINLQQLYYLFARKYGFSEKLILKFLQYHSEQGTILLKADKIIIPAKK